MLEQVLRSSKDPEKLSLTVNGVLMQAVAIIVAVFGALGSQLDVNILNQLVEVVSAIVATGAGLVGLIEVAWGLIRKLLP